MHDHHHHDSNHLHFHPSVENVDKNKITAKISNSDNFKGFDDFMYFAYKYWLVLKDDQETINKAKNTFIEVCTKFKKFKGSEYTNTIADKFVENLNNATDLMLNHELEEVTSLIEKFVKPYTLADKFMRNFNKRMNE